MRIRLERLRTLQSCAAAIFLLLLPMSALHAAGDVKKPSFEKIRRWAEKSEENAAGRQLDTPPQKLTKEIGKARAELEKYLAAKPDDVQALLLAARLGRAEIMVSPIEFIGAEALQVLQQMEPKRRQRVDELANYCDLALAVQHDNAEAYYWKSRLYGIRHFGIRDSHMAWVYVDLNLAAQFAKKAVDLDSHNVLYREALALYLVLNQKPDEAMEVMRDVAGGQHPIYVLLSDKMRLPLPERAVLLREDTEKSVQDSVEGGWKRDYPELRIFVYVVPMSALEVEDFYRRTWPQFKFFTIGNQKAGAFSLQHFRQLFLWRDAGFVPVNKLEDIPDEPMEGVHLALSEVQNQKDPPTYPVAVGNPYCLLTVRNIRPLKSP